MDRRESELICQDRGLELYIPNPNTFTDAGNKCGLSRCWIAAEYDGNSKQAKIPDGRVLPPK